MQETLVRFLGREGSLEKGKATHSSVLGPPCGSAGKESACNAGDLGLIPGLGRYPGKGKGYPLEYSGLENSMDNPQGCRESDLTEWLSFHYERDKCWSLNVSNTWELHINQTTTTNTDKCFSFAKWFFFFNLGKMISMLECKGKGYSQKEKIPSIHTQNDFPNSTNGAYNEAYQSKPKEENWTLQHPGQY